MDSSVKILLSLMDQIKNKKSYVIIHSIGDMDALGAAIALSELYGCQLVVVDKLSQPAQRFCLSFGIKYKKASEIMEDLLNSKYIIVIDCNTNSLLLNNFNNSFYIVIDHHQPTKNDEFKTGFKYIDTSAVATCEIIANIFDINKLSSVALLALAIGIYSDSYMLSDTSNRALNIFVELLNKSKASYSIVQQFAYPDIRIEERLSILRATKNMTFFRIGDIIIAFSFVSAYEGEAASSIISHGADIAFVFHSERSSEAVYQNNQGEHLSRLSIRISKKMSVYLSASGLASKIAETFGCVGGGHLFAAGVNNLQSSYIQSVVDFIILNVINNIYSSRFRYSKLMLDTFNIFD